MLKFKDSELGKKFHKLTIVGKGSNETRVKVRCECGNTKEMLLHNVIYGNSRSCGCVGLLRISRMGRNRVKFTVQTPEGPRSIIDISREYDVSYTRILYRYKIGIRDIKELVSNIHRGPGRESSDERLNGMSQKEAVEFFKMSKQLVSLRLKRGWRLTSDNKWVSPLRGISEGVRKISKEAQKRLDSKRKLLKELSV